MWADIPTKPLQGHAFRKMRSKLMNIPKVYIEDETPMTYSGAPKSIGVLVRSTTGVTGEITSSLLASTTKKERPETEGHNHLRHLFAGVCWGKYSPNAARSLAGTHSLAAAGGARIKTY